MEDACQAHGARYRGKPAHPGFSPYAAYSFYPTKNLGCLGDGGAVATSKASVGKHLREVARRRPAGGQVSYVSGINSRLDEMHACFLRAFLPKLGEWNEDRPRMASFYYEALRDCPGLRIVERTADSVCHLYVVRAEKRDRLREFLSNKGIGTGVHYRFFVICTPLFAIAG